MGLTGEQWRFIAARLLTNTDKEAAEQVGIVPKTVSNWKQEYPEFVEQYEASFTDGVDVAKSYTRKLLGKAAQRLSEGLDATKTVAVLVHGGENGERAAIEVPDHQARLKAIELAFKTHGLLSEKREVDLNVREADALFDAFHRARRAHSSDS